MTGTDLAAAEPATVINRVTGEALTVADADTPALARYVHDQGDVRRMLADELALVTAELTARLDRDGSWTHKFEDGGRFYTVTTASPTAGTDDYHLDVLVDALRRLLGEDKITPEAARAAVKRTVTITASVDVDVSLPELRERLLAIDAIDCQPVYDVSVAVAEKWTAAGVARLRRMGGDAATAVELAHTLVDPPVRKVSVKVKDRPPTQRTT